MSSSKRKVIIAGNWKMHKTRPEASSLVKGILEFVKANNKELPEIVLCPPFTSLACVSDAIADSSLSLGAQNMDWHESGAYTGEVSAGMLLDLKVEYVLIGHSERRQYFGETNKSVADKVQAALKAKLTPIICVGETADEREAGLTDSVVTRQVAASVEDLMAEDVAKVVFAYEPVWAIGTGKVCEAKEADRVHKLIRLTVSNLFGRIELGNVISVLYGGSVKPENIEEQLALENIDGSLVGGASLKADDFNKLIAAGQKRLKLTSVK